jgi:hypothetical protein
MHGSVISHITPEQTLDTLALLANWVVKQVKCEGQIAREGAWCWNWETAVEEEDEEEEEEQGEEQEEEEEKEDSAKAIRKNSRNPGN